MPAVPTAEADRCEGNGDGIESAAGEAGGVQTVAGGCFGECVSGVFVAAEAFFLGSGKDLAVSNQRRRGVVAQGSADPEHDHG